MNCLQRMNRYVVMRVHETRRVWKYFKEDAMKFWQYGCFRGTLGLHRAWPFAALAWLLSKRVPKGKEQRKFRGNQDGMSLPEDLPRYWE